MEWNKIGLMFSLSRFKTYVNITTSTDCYLVPGSIVPLSRDHPSKGRRQNVDVFPNKARLFTPQWGRYKAGALYKSKSGQFSVADLVSALRNTKIITTNQTFLSVPVSSKPVCSVRIILCREYYGHNITHMSELIDSIVFVFSSEVVAG